MTAEDATSMIVTRDAEVRMEVEERVLHCSFCGKSQKQVKKIIAGPGVFICDECVMLCTEIITEAGSGPGDDSG